MNKNKGFLIWIIIGLSGLILTTTGWVHYSGALHHRDVAYAKYVSAMSRYKANVQSVQSLQIVTDASGHKSPSITAMNRFLQTTFTNLLTFDSNKQYDRNRTNAMRVIHDASFFKDYMPADRDKTGHSMIEALGIKNEVTSVAVYPYAENHYYIMVTSMPYQKASDLKSKALLEKTYSLFDVTGTRGNVTKAEKVKGFSPVH